MSHPKYHHKINNVAYFLLKEKIGSVYFPKKEQMLIYDTFISPDTLHVFKHIYGFKKFNHLNSEKYNGGYVFALSYYDKLVKRLKNKKGALCASWLGHFIVDCLEPMHLFNWKVHDLKKRKQNLRLHAWTEINTKNIIITKKEIIEIKESLPKYIQKKSNEIRKLDIKNHYPKNKEKILETYEKKIAPLHVQAVASIWYKAVCEANEL
jgi:hypothetical protein